MSVKFQIFHTVEKYLLLFMFFVPIVNGFSQFVQLFTVIQLNFGFASENVLKFIDYGLLNFQPIVQTFQLIIQLHSDVWK